MLKGIVLILFILAIVVFSFKTIDQFKQKGQTEVKEATYLPKIGSIMKDVKGLKKTSEDNLERHEDLVETK